MTYKITLFLYILYNLSFKLLAADQTELVDDYELSFLYDKENSYTEESVLDAKFSKIGHLPFNRGLKNGVYWFSIKYNNTLGCGQSVIFYAKEPYINSACAYVVENNKAKQVYEQGNHLKFQERAIPARYIPIPITLKPGEHTYLLKVRFPRFVSFNFSVVSERQYYLNETREMSMASLYYGFALMVLILNLFYYYKFRDKSFMLYALALISISATLMHLDGLMVYFIQPGWFLDHIDIFIYAILAAAGGFVFASDFLGIQESFPNLKRIEKYMLILILGLFIVFLIHQDALFFTLGAASMLLFLAYYWVVSLFLIKKKRYAFFFSLAYALILFSALGYAFPLILGIKNSPINSNELKIGGAIEMLILSYAVVCRMSTINRLNKSMHIEIQQYMDRFKQIDESKHEDNTANNSEQLLSNLEIIKQENNLTEREIDVLLLISKGHTNPQIAEKLYVSVNTIKYHTRNIYQKLGISNRTEAINEVEKCF